MARKTIWCLKGGSSWLSSRPWLASVRSSVGRMEWGPPVEATSCQCLRGCPAAQAVRVTFSVAVCQQGCLLIHSGAWLQGRTSIYKTQKQPPGCTWRPAVSEPDSPRSLFPWRPRTILFASPCRSGMKSGSGAQSSGALGRLGRFLLSGQPQGSPPPG